MEALGAAALTIIGGLLIFVGGQFLQRFILEPIQEQRKIIGEIAFVLTFLANVDSVLTPPAEQEKAKDTVRTLAGKLRASLSTIPNYGFWAARGVVPKQEAVITASANLIGWSNSITDARANHEKRQNIAQALNIVIG